MREPGRSSVSPLTGIMEVLERGLPAVDSLYARARRLRSPYAVHTISTSGDDYSRERPSISNELGSRLRGCTNDFVRRSQGVLALAKMHRLCACELASSVESAGDTALPDLAAALRDLAQLQASAAVELGQLVGGCAQVAAAQISLQDEQLRRAERESAELLDAADNLERQMRTTADERSALTTCALATAPATARTGGATHAVTGWDVR